MSHGNVYKIQENQLNFSNQFLKLNATVGFDKSPAFEQVLE